MGSRGLRKSNQRDEHHDEAARDHLVSFATLARQEELTLRYSPSILSNIDFDILEPDLAMHLLDLHWNRQHLSYLTTYRPAIMDSLIHNGKYCNKLLLNAIYLQSCLYSDRRFPIEAGTQAGAFGISNPPAASRQPHPWGHDFYDRFKSLLPQYIDKPTIPTITALLTCGSCLVPHGQQSGGWILCGIAYRMMSDIGYQFDNPQATTSSGSPKIPHIEDEMRKRLYWGAYVGDKFQSLFLGRMPALHKANSTVSREYLDSYEEMELWSPYRDPQPDVSVAVSTPYTPRPAYALSTFRCLLELCDIATDIIEGFYATESLDKDADSLISTRRDIRMQLDIWREQIPPWLNFEPGQDPTPPPHQVTIQQVTRLPRHFLWHEMNNIY